MKARSRFSVPGIPRDRDIISPLGLVVLVAILDLTRGQYTTGVREICRKLDLSPHSVHKTLRLLKKRGVVRWEYGKTNTVRATVALIPLGDLVAQKRS